MTQIMKGLRGGAKAAQDPLKDLASFPILTEEVGYPPSPLAMPSGATPGGGAGGGAGSLGQIVNKAMSSVLGWKVKAGDSKGFMGALTQSFKLNDFEGHTEAIWTPRTYVVQSDLAGGITGAQASVYSRGKEALDQSLPLLDGLYTLDPEADQEDVTALKAVAKSQLTELVNELGFLGGPRITRVNQYFRLLLIDAGAGAFPPFPAGTPLTVDPDQIGGTLGNLRDVLGLNFTDQDFVNSVGDEQNLSNYRILADYVTSLAQSWLNNLPFLGLDTPKPFFGTQLVLLSRQLSVVAESVDEVRFTLDSVFIGPAERQTTELTFGSGHPELRPLFLEDLLSWIRSFATEEGPGLIQDGGKFAVHNTVTPVVKKLLTMVVAIPKTFNPSNPLPPAFFAPRVRLAIENLIDELSSLLKLAKPIEHEITSEPDFGLPFRLDEVVPVFLSDPPEGSTTGPTGSIPVHVRGSGFQYIPTVSFSGTQPLPTIVPGGTYFRSESLLIVRIARPLHHGTWDVHVINADKQPPAGLTLKGGFTIGP